MARKIKDDLKKKIAQDGIRNVAQYDFERIICITYVENVYSEFYSIFWLII